MATSQEPAELETGGFTRKRSLLEVLLYCLGLLVLVESASRLGGHILHYYVVDSGKLTSTMDFEKTQYVVDVLQAVIKTIIGGLIIVFARALTEMVCSRRTASYASEDGDQLSRRDVLDAGLRILGAYALVLALEPLHLVILCLMFPSMGKYLYGTAAPWVVSFGFQAVALMTIGYVLLLWADRIVAWLFRRDPQKAPK